MRQESEIERGPTGIRFTCRIITMIRSAPVRRASRIHVTPARRAVQKAPPRKKTCNQRVRKQNFHPACSSLPISSLFRRPGFHKTARSYLERCRSDLFLSLSLTFPIEYVSFPFCFFFFSFSQPDTFLRFWQKGCRLVGNFGARWLYFLILQRRTLTVE